MTPASLVLCARRQGDEEGATSQPVRKVLRMERHLHERLSAEDGDFLLHQDMARDLMAEGRLAAARDVSGLWARARVEQVLRLPDGDQAQVFLLDHGRSVRVRRPDASLRPLLRREDPARVPPLAQTFILLGSFKKIRSLEVFFGVKHVFPLFQACNPWRWLWIPPPPRTLRGSPWCWRETGALWRAAWSWPPPTRPTTSGYR